MIEIGTLVTWRDGSLGIITETYTTERGTIAYMVRWFDDGSIGVLSDRDFKVVS